MIFIYFHFIQITAKAVLFHTEKNPQNGGPVILTNFFILSVVQLSL